MKTFAKVALTALTALATLAPTANAKFQDKHGNTFYEPTDFQGAHATLVKRLNQVGVPVLDGRGTNLCANENVLGWYTGEKNFMVICYGDQALRAETLAHEAMHVVQDCRAGLNNNDLHITKNRYRFSQVVKGLGYKADLIINQYDKEDWDIEAEAFYYETRPAAVRALVDSNCPFKF
jgi:hypothetical protein